MIVKPELGAAAEPAIRSGNRVSGIEDSFLQESMVLIRRVASDVAAAISNHPEIQTELITAFEIATNLGIDGRAIEKARATRPPPGVTNETRLPIRPLSSDAPSKISTPIAPPPNGPVDKPPLTSDDGNMEARITALEKDMAIIKTDVAIIRSNYATKSDLINEIGGLRSELHKELSAQTWRLVTFVCGFGATLVAAVYFIAKHVP